MDDFDGYEDVIDAGLTIYIKLMKETSRDAEDGTLRHRPVRRVVPEELEPELEPEPEPEPAAAADESSENGGGGGELERVSSRSMFDELTDAEVERLTKQAKRQVGKSWKKMPESARRATVVALASVERMVARS